MDIMSILTEDPILITFVQEISIMPSTQADPEAAAEAVPVPAPVPVRVVAEPDAARRIHTVYQEDGVNRIPARENDS